MLVAEEEEFILQGLLDLEDLVEVGVDLLHQEMEHQDLKILVVEVVVPAAVALLSLVVPVVQASSSSLTLPK